MNEVLKQRLVGALILVALAVIFWPIVFVQNDDSTTVPRQAIPQPPEVPSEAIETPDAAGLRASPELTPYEGAQGMADADADSATAEGAASPAATAAVGSGGGSAVASAPVAPARTAPAATQDTAATAVRTKAPPPLATDTDGVPVAWTLRVATVSSAEKAEELRKRLLDKHEKAYVTAVSAGGKQLYRVSIGPKFERQELERIQAGINAEFGVTTMLVRYLP